MEQLHKAEDKIQSKQEEEVGKLEAKKGTEAELDASDEDDEGSNEVDFLFDENETGDSAQTIN